MSILEWTYLGLFISSLIFLLTSITLLVIYIYNQRKIKKMRRKKKYKRKIPSLKKQRKKTLVFLIICLFLSVITGAGAAYTSYYQSVNLTEKDSQSVVDGYYYLADFKKQLVLIQNGKAEEKAVTENIQNLSSYMAAYSGKRASDLNTGEGQVVLNRYYNALKELGINASRQSQEFIGDSDLVEEFLSDVEKAERYQLEAFKYYKVDESALKKEL